MVHGRRLAAAAICGLLFFSQAFAQHNPLPNIKAGLNVGAYVAGEEFTRTVEDYTLRPALSVFYEHPFASNYGLSSTLIGGIISKDIEDIRKEDATYPFNYLSYKTTVIGAILGPYYRVPFTANTFSALVHLNFGTFMRVTTGVKDEAYFADPMGVVVTYGIGFTLRYAIAPNMSAQAVYSGFLTNSDQLDGFGSGVDHDGFSSISIGLAWNLFGNRYDDDPNERFAENIDGVADEGGDITTFRADRKAVWKASNSVNEESDDQVVSMLLSSSLEINQFTSLNELEKDGGRLVLSLEKTGRTPLPLDVNFELIRDGKIIAQGVKHIELFQRKAALVADQFIDFHGLNVLPGYEATLPDGKYDLNIVVEDRNSDISSRNSLSFIRVDMDKTFGENTTSMRDLIASRKVEILPSKNNEVVIRVMPEHGSYNVASTRAVRASRGPAPDNQALLDEMKKAEIETEVSARFDVALGIQNKLMQDTVAKRKPVILLAEIEFGNDGSSLSEEAKQVLDNIARRMRRHPQIVVQIRGYADEHKDNALNQSLAEMRATRVMDFMTRQLVPNYRLSVNGVTPADAAPKPGQETLALNGKVELVMTSY